MLFCPSSVLWIFSLLLLPTIAGGHERMVKAEEHDELERCGHGAALSATPSLQPCYLLSELGLEVPRIRNKSRKSLT